MEKIVSLCKRRGFVFPGSEIYGGLANTWDYGPYGVELMNNVKKLWWSYFIHRREDMVGLDAAILMNPRVWEASGHVTSFSDPLVDCKKCHERIRGDKLIEENFGKDFFTCIDDIISDIEKRGAEHPMVKENIRTGTNKDPSWWVKETRSDLEKRKKNSISAVNYILKHDRSLKCPKCGASDFTESRSFNLMFKTYQGVIEEDAAMVYLRPETAQGIFVNFKNVQQTTRKKIPFGIGQIGKAFRNEITPGNFTFRTREFEQMEIEYFVHESKWKNIYDSWRENMNTFFVQELGFKKDNMRWRQHDKDELSHYSKETWDIEYQFPFGWGELWGIAYRTDYDLKQHEEFSGEKLEYLDPETNEKFVPHCIEPTFGVTRTVLVALLEAYDEDQVFTEKPGKTPQESVETRVVMRFSPKLAPVKAAVLPLMKKEPLGPKAREIFQLLAKHFVVEYDESGSVGKRYRRQDEIGTPYCFTVDFQTLEDDTVTVRDRDTMKQERVNVKEILSFLQDKTR